MASFLDAILGMSGQERTEALRQFGRDLEYYVPPELRGILGLAAEMTPTATLERAAQAGGEMMAPDRTAMERLGSAGQMLSETAGVAAPMMVAGRAAMPAAQAIQEGLLGFSMAADDAGRRFVERMNQPGPVPTMYSNPVGRADKPMTVFHGGPTKVTSPRATVDPEGLPLGFSVTGNKDIAQNYANMRGGGVVSEFSVDPSKYNPISEFDLYQLQDDLEVKLGFDEGDLPEDVLLSELRSRGINAIEYPDPEFGTRIIDPSILSPTLPAPRNEAEAMAKQVLEMRAAGRAGDVTEEMMAATDPQYMFANTPLPMDEASRMARARELGFTKEAYHGGKADFQAIDPEMAEDKTYGTGIWFSDNPDVSATYAGGIYDSGQTYPSLLNVENFAPSNWRGRGWGDAAPETRMSFPARYGRPSSRIGDIYEDWTSWPSTDSAARAANQGELSGLEITNVTDIGPNIFNRADLQKRLPETASSIAVFDPQKARSRFARFDPAFAHLRNLSAGVGGLGILSSLDQQDQEREEEIRQYLGGLL